MTKTSLACLLLLLPLAGCTLFQSKATRALHASPDYKAGYADGCASGQDSVSRAPAARDEDAFAGNQAYGAGWREGASACRMMASPGMNMAPPTP